MSRRLWSGLLAGLSVGLLAAACGGAGSVAAPPAAPDAQSPAEAGSAPAAELPAEVRDAPANVQAAYRFAIANKELLEQIPCFCGCVAQGHSSNYSCYVAEDGGPGAIIEYETHALG